MTRKSGHIWRIWAEMTQTLMPKSTKVAQIHLPECNSAKFPPKFAKIRQISARSPLALEAFLHLHAWHARYLKDSGSKYCLELNTHSAGVYGIAFELHTVLQHQWKYGPNWVEKLKDFDLLTHYGKRKLCESAQAKPGLDCLPPSGLSACAGSCGSFLAT